MKALVIGASGFLGGHVYQLLKSMPQMTAVGTYGRNRLDTDLCPVNLASYQSVQSMINAIEPDVVFWCAKHTSDSSERELNLIGLRSLLESAKSSMRLIFVSTDGLLPGTYGNYDEKTVPVPINSNSSVALYTNSKLEAEGFIASSWGNYCIARVGPIYGRSVTGHWDQRIAGLVEAFNRGEIISRAENIRRTFIHVEDLAKGLVELVTTDYTGIIHLGPTESSCYFDFARTVCTSFQFRENLVHSSTISHEEMDAKAIRADTTLDTQLAKHILQTPFREITQGIVESVVSCSSQS